MADSEVGGFEVGDEAYAHRIFTGGNRLTRWSHTRRSATAVSLLKDRHFDRVADVGGADGWFLRALVEAGVASGGVVYDIDPSLLEAGQRFSDAYPTIDFVLNDGALPDSLRGSFDLVICMETLEHVPDPGAVLDTVVNLTRTHGWVKVSVPVEVGPALLVKQLGRWAADRRGGYGYGRYAWRELLQASALGRLDGVERANLHSHKGFDYREVRTQLRERATIVHTHWSPLRLLGPLGSSTVTWLAQPGPDRPSEFTLRGPP